MLLLVKVPCSHPNHNFFKTQSIDNSKFCAGAGLLASTYWLNFANSGLIAVFKVREQIVLPPGKSRYLYSLKPSLS